MTKRPEIILSFLLAIVTFFAYLPAYHGEMIWDDDVHIPSTPALQSVDGLRNMWLKIGTTPQYYPLTHTSLWIEWQFWQNNTFGYHVDNVVLHIVASLLVVALLKRMQIPGAWLAGFVFALHPVHVESVAWISERKNTLSIVLALLAMISYPGLRPIQLFKKHEFVRWSTISLFFFLLAIFSKTVICTLPAVILVLIWWKRGRITRQDIVPLVPFFVMTIVVSITTSRMEKEVVRAIGADWDINFLQRLHIAGRAIWWYAGKVFWPGELAFSYSRWNPSITSLVDMVPVIGAVLLLIIAFVWRNRIGRGLAATLLIFGGILFPALSFFNLYPHRYSFVADHFQYHADVAMIAFSSAVLTIAARKLPVYMPQVAGCLLVGLLAVKTYSQSQIYQDSETLWHDTIIKTPDSWLAHISYADILVSKYNDPIHLNIAIDSYLNARVLRPQADQVATSLGATYARLGRTEDSALAYATAENVLLQTIRTEPDLARASKARLRLGALYERLNRFDDAINIFREGDAALPQSEVFAGNVIRICLNHQRYDTAIPYLKKICNLHPGELGFLFMLAECYEKNGQIDESLKILKNLKLMFPNNSMISTQLDRVTEQLNKKPATQPSSP